MIDKLNDNDTLHSGTGGLTSSVLRYLISDPERMVLGTWSLVTIVLGGFGNILVLVGLFYDRFKFDVTSTWFLSNMAISDFLYVLFVVVPSAFSNFSNRWLFGRFLCGLTASLSSMFCIIHLLSLTLLSANKLFRCLYPLKSMYTVLTAWTGTLITFLLWILSLIPVIIYYVLDKPTTFDRNMNRCTVHDENTGPFWKKFNKICFLFYIALPLFISVVSNGGLFLIVIKKATTVDKAKISMILCLSALAVIAWLPAIIYGTVFNSSGYPIYLRFSSYVISLDATFSILLLIYFYPAFRNFVLWVMTCGIRGVGTVDKKVSLKMSTYVSLRERLSKTMSSKSIAIRTAMMSTSTRGSGIRSSSSKITALKPQVLQAVKTFRATIEE